VICSMTGYGRKEARTVDSVFTIEIRSVNNRYIDVQARTPRDLAVLEPRLRKAVQERFSRGRFDLFISRNGNGEKPGALALDYELAEKLAGHLKGLKERLSLSGEVDLALLLGVFPDLITREEVREDVESLWQVISRGLVDAMADLQSMRAAEGAALARDISERLAVIERLTAAVRSLAPATVDHARKRIADAVNRLVGAQPDPARLAQEVAFLAERTDVTEELTRLDSHIGQFRSMVEDGSREAVGRKLDFLLQEMGREANTIASKAMDAEISLNVVTIKAELEKIREQVQNIE
jgi:uncharacterized protein (TIGR00255 family)